MSVTASQMAAFTRLLASNGMSREQIEHAVSATTEADSNLARNQDGSNPVTIGTIGNQDNISIQSPNVLEAAFEAAREKNARAKTASNRTRKLESPFSRAQLIRLNDSKREQDKSSIKSGHSPMYTSLCGIDRKFSEAQLKDLERVNIEDLLLGKTHRGQYLLVRTVSTPAMKDSVSVVIEDPKGRVELLSISNYPLGKIRTGPELDGIIPQGTIIAILEPTYETPSEMPLNLAGGHVRVDSPTDISFLSTNDILVRAIVWSTPSPSREISNRIDWKERGNHFFKLKQYRAAIAKYSEGIRQLSDATTWTCKVGVLYLNRAAAHLLIGNYNAALQDSSKFLQMFEHTDNWGEESAVSFRAKALFRVAKSLDGLRLYSKAREAYLAVLAHDPNRSEASTAIARLDKRLDEARNGTHDICNMLKTALANSEAPLDVSDYVGPIRVQDMSNRGGGRGIVATRDISAGELLVVEKAVAISYKCKAGEPQITSYNPITNTITGSENYVLLVRSLVRAILDNPDLGDVVDALYGGESYQPALFPFESRYQRERDIPSRAPSAKRINMERLEQVCATNSFSLELHHQEYSQNAVESLPSGASGLFPLTSIFNHQCAPSAIFTTYVDMMVIRARESIQAGEEICISYFDFDSSYETRQEELSSHFPSGECQCKLCVADKADGLKHRTRRLQLLDEQGSMIEQLKSNSPNNARKLESWFSSLEATYSKSRSSLRSELLGPSTVLSLQRKRAGNIQGYLYYIVIALEALGIRLTHSVRKKGKGGKFSVPKVAIIEGALGSPQRAVLIILTSVEVLRRHGDLEEASAWAQAAFDVEDIASGGGKQFFFTKYQKAFSQLDEGLENFMKRQE